MNAPKDLFKTYSVAVLKIISECIDLSFYLELDKDTLLKYLKKQNAGLESNKISIQESDIYT